MLWEKDDFVVSANKDDVNIDILHGLLKTSYWAQHRTRDEVEASIENSMCFTLLKKEQMIGFVRVLTDTMAYAIMLDMIITSEYRGKGLGQWMMKCICEHPQVAPLRQLLWPGDADKFYNQCEFTEMSSLKFMSRNWNM
jgi:predicted GNAT family N-acyltransferase